MLKPRAMVIDDDISPYSGVFTTKVEAMAYGGKGISRVDGKVLFAEGAIPGDTLKVRLTEDKGRYATAIIESVVEPSPLRQASPCAYSEECGGCQWQGIAYEQQLEWKRGFVAAALERIGKLPGATAPSIELIGSSTPQNYRNRILLRLHVAADGHVDLGYFRRGTHELVPISACSIAAPALNRSLAAIRSLNLHHLAGLRVRLELQEVNLPETQLVATVYPSDGGRQAASAFVAHLRALPDVAWAGLVFDLESAPLVPFEHDLGIQFLTQAGQFQQVNLALNRVLRRLVKEHTDTIKAKRILDLFCGSGNLSLPLADGLRYIEGIESNKKAIRCANATVDHNQLSGFLYLAGDAEKHLWKCSRANEEFDLVILDPPRQGMYQGMIPLKNLNPQHIIYVSCDPTTLARDLGALCKKNLYRIERLVALDFFPNTYHIETVAFLRHS